MKYDDFESIVSAERLNRYLDACNGDKRASKPGKFSTELKLRSEKEKSITY